MIFAREADLAAGQPRLAAALIRVRGAIDIAGALVRTPTSTPCVRAFSLLSKWEAQEIVIGENKQFPRRSESLPTRFPCFRYTTAQQPTSLRRKLSPTLRWPIGGHRSFYSPYNRRLFVKQNVGPAYRVPVTGPAPFILPPAARTRRVAALRRPTSARSSKTKHIDCLIRTPAWTGLSIFNQNPPGFFDGIKNQILVGHDATPHRTEIQACARGFVPLHSGTTGTCVGYRGQMRGQRCCYYCSEPFLP
jgi:hypothetical protein